MTTTPASEPAQENQLHNSSAEAMPNQPSSTSMESGPVPGLSRRTFLGHAGSLAGATLGVSLSGSAAMARPSAATQTESDEAATESTTAAQTRAEQAYQLRVQLAKAARDVPLPDHLVNGDEDRYPNRISCYTKGLPLNDRGEVDAATYDALLHAITTADDAAFEAIALGGTAKLTNPQAAYSFELVGPDSHHLGMPAPPTFDSAEQAGELVELYWAALTRDVPFALYETDPMIAQAAAELSSLHNFRGPTIDGVVTPGTLFRDTAPGNLDGPYLSQFLLWDIPYGATTVPQRYRVPLAGEDHMTDVAEWLTVQRGGNPVRGNQIDPTPRYLRSGRDLGEYVHQDFSYQSFLNAALILLTLRAPKDAGNPYLAMRTTGSFATFGPPVAVEAVAKVSGCALKACWYQKWAVHRRVRPEAYAGRVHLTTTGAAEDPIHADVLQSQALSEVIARHGTALLPQAFPEGSPTHPAYPAGHAVVAGACATVLKTLFDEAFILPEPMEASPDGLALQSYDGELTVGNELNKLAANIAIGRNTAGVHWRSDGEAGLLLGEALAIGMLTEMRACVTEGFEGFSLTKFDGTTITV